MTDAFDITNITTDWTMEDLQELLAVLEQVEACSREQMAAVDLHIMKINVRKIIANLRRIDALPDRRIRQ